MQYATIDRALVLCGYQDDPKGLALHGKYKQLFGRNELKLTIINLLREAPADDTAITARIMTAKGWSNDIRPDDVLKRVRHAILRAQKDGHDMRGTEEKGVDTLLATDLVGLAWRALTTLRFLSPQIKILYQQQRTCKRKVSKSFMQGFRPRVHY